MLHIRYVFVLFCAIIGSLLASNDEAQAQAPFSCPLSDVQAVNAGLATFPDTSDVDVLIVGTDVNACRQNTANSTTASNDDLEIGACTTTGPNPQSLCFVGDRGTTSPDRLTDFTISGPGITGTVTPADDAEIDLSAGTFTVTFTNLLSGVRTFSFTIVDVGGPNNQRIMEQVISITPAGPANTAPVITGGDTAAVNAAENQTAVTDVQATDDTNSEGSGLTYSFSTILSGGADNGLFTLNTTSGLLTFTAAPDFETPNSNAGSNVYQVQVTVTDAGGLFDIQNITVTVTDVVENTAPVLGGTPPNDTAVEDVATAIDLSAYNVSDADGDTITLTLAVNRGTIASTNNNGVTAGVTVANSGTASMTLQGTAANLNTYLNNTALTTFTTAANDTTTAVLTVTPNDGTVNGTADTVSITISQVNDAPEVSSLPASVSGFEDTTFNVDLSAASFTDVDSPAITVTLTASAGTFEPPALGVVTATRVSATVISLNGTPSNINTYLNTASNIRYTGALNANGNPEATITVTANDADGSSNVNLGTVNINITAVNDEPSVAVGANQSVGGSGVGGVQQTVNSFASMSDDGDPEVTQGVADFIISEDSDPNNAVSGVDISNAGVLTYTPAAGVSGTATINVQVQDDGGTANSGDNTSQVSQFTITVDTLAPTVAITGVPGTTNGISTFTATFTFNEAVTDFDDVGDVTATNATVGTIAATSPTIYTAVITPNGGGDVTVDVPANAAIDAVGNGNTTAPDQTATLDNTAPTVAITGVPATTNGTTAFTATFTFNEAVTDFDDVGDVTATNATVGTIAATSPTIYTAVITPNGGGDVTVDVPANAAIDAVGNGNTTAPDQTATLDNTAPTVAITGVPTVTNGTTAFTATFTFSEPVTDFDDVGDVTATNATVGAIAATSTTVYTALITPNGGGDVTVDVPASAAIDVAGNGNTTAPDQTATLDNTAPTVAITGVPTVTNGTTAFTATFTFSEPVTDFDDVGDVTATNATVGAISSTSSTVYTAVITPDGGGNVTVDVPANAAIDVAGNGNTTAPDQTATLDNTGPTVTITTDSGGSFNESAPGTFTATVTFNENVTGFAPAEITATNATVAAAFATGSDGNAVYTIMVTPAGTGDVALNVAAAVAQDGVANDNTAAPQVTVTQTDDVAPTAISIVRQNPVNENTDADTLTFRVTFSEDVTMVSIADFTVNGSTASATSGAGITGSVFDLVVSGGDLAGLDGTVGLDFDPTQDITDTAGNPFGGAEPPIDQTYAVNNSVPTATITTDSGGSFNESAPGTFIATITFSEPVTGFVDSELTATNATIAALSPAGGAGTVFTATITPDNTGDVVLNVAAGVAQDAFANDNTVAPTVTVIQTDDVGPTLTPVTIVSSNADPTIAVPGDTITVSFTANEALMPPAPTVTIAGQAATLAGMSPSFTATLVVDGTTPLGAAAINITGFQDTAGNAGAPVTAATDGSVVTVGVAGPTVEETQALIASFMSNRANNILSNQPNLGGFITGSNLGNGQLGNLNVNGNEEGFSLGFATSRSQLLAAGEGRTSSTPVERINTAFGTPEGLTRQGSQVAASSDNENEKLRAKAHAAASGFLHGYVSSDERQEGEELSSALGLSSSEKRIVNFACRHLGCVDGSLRLTNQCRHIQLIPLGWLCGSALFHG